MNHGLLEDILLSHFFGIFQAKRFIIRRTFEVPRPSLVSNKNAMEGLKNLWYDKEKLLDRLEELYEDDVEVKSLNHPGNERFSSRRLYAKQFWSKISPFLPPKMSLQMLSRKMRKRRFERQNCLQEALALLQEDDVCLRRNEEEENIYDSIVTPSDESKSPKKEPNRKTQRALSLAVKTTDPSCKKRLKRSLESADKVVALEEENVIGNKESSSGDIRHRKRTDFLKRDATLRTKLMKRSVKSMRWGDLHAFAPDSLEFKLQLEILCNENMESGKLRPQEFWRQLENEFPNANRKFLSNWIKVRRYQRKKAKHKAD